MKQPGRHGSLVVDPVDEVGLRWREIEGLDVGRSPLDGSLMLWPPEVEMNVLRMTAGAVGAPTLVLLVEDSPGDVRLIRDAFHDANDAIYLHVAGDGVEAMAFLRRQGPHLHAPRPDLILLDLNLPRMDGREVLAEISHDETLKTIPTCVLSTSIDDADIRKSYEHRANAYLSKPVHLEAFESLVRSINDFWLTKASLPH